MAEAASVKGKSMNDLLSQMQRIYEAAGGYRGVTGENRARYERAVGALERYERNIMGSARYARAFDNAVNRGLNFDQVSNIVENLRVSRRSYMRRRNNR